MFLLLSYAPVLIVAIIWASQPGFMTEYWQVTSNFYTTLEKVVYFCFFFGVLLSMPIQILLICKPFCELREITMNASLSGMTKQNVIEMTVGETTYLGFFVMFVSHYCMVSPLMTTCDKTTCIVNILLPMLFTVFLVPMVLFSQILVLCWITEIEKKLRHKDKEEGIVAWGRSCVILYQKTETVMGPFLAFHFITMQLVWITSFFLASVVLFGSNKMGTKNLLMHSLGG